MKSLGIHTFVWTGSTAKADLDAAMAKSAELGYGLIEFPRLDPNSPDLDIDWLGKRLQDHRLKAALTMGLTLHSDISSEDADAVARGEQILDDAVRVTRDLGSQILGGILYSAHTKYQTMPTQQGWRNSVDVIGRVAERAKASGVSLNLEVVNRFESNLINTAAQGLEFIAATGSDNVFIHLDTFHMMIEETDPSAAIRMVGDKLGYFHLGESHRGYLGAGLVNFPAIFDALIDIGYHGEMTFESFSNTVVDRHLSATCAIWRNTWTDNVELARAAKGFIETRYAEALRRAATLRGTC